MDTGRIKRINRIIQTKNKGVMKEYKVYYKANLNGRWKVVWKIVNAVSEMDAKKNADLWEKLIIRVVVNE